ncbi:LacI family transcriptional regulator [Ignatzschineria rhizosphaerae]|uniref:LacI family transcriptional regulator n=1 Tax=Ignatzschineria rhizosphaerae TaxID=2923279 RepID=A0ABY3X202_9GAMM|nr:LacI family DNA-binding transcriptional regulator [Ignatzschineria rhizosphaerae]UNM96913.1 LacI family transcriptional regulator [Ignatzschineria rhizosphaerae]
MKKNKKILEGRASSINVAKLAKVSQATVSRVLNHPDKVGEETRNRVLKAIEELKYVPNQNARDLVSGSSKVITLISGPLENPFFVDSTASIVHFATEKGYKVNIYIVDDSDIEETYRQALSNRPDGLIMSCIFYDDPIIEHLERLDIPFVTFNRRHRQKLNYVEFDNYSAAKQACHFLYEKQYDSIFWVGGMLDVSTFKYRFKGFKDTYEEIYQSTLNPLDFMNKKVIDYNMLRENIWYWYQKNPGKKAILAATDSIAINLLSLTKEMGLSCPDEVGIIGIDNVELSKHPYINLTTVGGAQNLGLIAIQELIYTIEHQSNTNIAYTISTQIFDRGTIK